MGLAEDNATSETKPTQPIERHSRQPSETSCYATEEEEEGNKEDEEEEARLQLGPICSIKKHLEKDKDDESLRRWKEQLLGSVDVNAVEETLELDVKILSLTILYLGRPDLVLEIPANGDPKGVWFTLKEDTCYHLRFSIQLIARSRCSEPSVLRLRLTYMRCQKRLPPLECSQEDHIWQKQRK